MEHNKTITTIILLQVLAFTRTKSAHIKLYIF